MKKFKKIIFSDWMVGILLTFMVLGAYLLQWYPLLSLEYKAYDFRAGLVVSEPVDSPIVIIRIDDQSIEQIGGWPWPRRYMASLIDLLTTYEAKVIGLNIFYTEPVADESLMEFDNIKNAIEEMPGYTRNAQLMQVYEQLSDAEQALNNDAILAGSILRSGKVVLPLSFAIDYRMDNAEVQLPDYLKNNSIVSLGDEFYSTAVDTLAPLPEFAEGALGIGHDNLFPDPDGTIRKTTLLIDYGRRLFPSFDLQIAMRYLSFTPESLDLSDGMKFGKIHIPVNLSQEMFIKYRGGTQTFKSYSFADVVMQNVAPKEFKDKIVLVGFVGTGLGPLVVTPVENTFPTIEIRANIIDNMLSRDFIYKPEWAFFVELGAIILFGLILSFVIPRLKAFPSALIAAVLLIIYNGAAIYLFTSQGMWLMMLPASFLMVTGYIVIISKRFMVTEQKKEKVEGESIETNKMLGLSFQGQGMLDLALEKFMRVPIDGEDESIKDHLYNLALDFERKRQFNKSVSIYEHIKTAGNFRDIEDKIEKLTKVGETMIFGGSSSPFGGGGGNDSTVIVDGAEMTPTLGRYEIIKELGKGAMGVVYLGRDPKINRQVAIKTMRFDEIEEDQRKDVKERFFREAEAAGKLSHPNIVTILDAGEDYDLAYIAMELLDGVDLSDYLLKVKGKRVAVKMAIRLVGQVAEALDYAHSNGIVHRDIKPANIMLVQKGVAKVTDFGIARVVETSKTQTGVVLGTPSYMSPEQVVGKKVDGRSDLFSLGVMFYELISGKKPFIGDSMAALMYNIANNPHPPLSEAAPGVPPCCVKIADKFLEKDFNKRYQRGNEALRDLKACFKSLK